MIELENFESDIGCCLSGFQQAPVGEAREVQVSVSANTKLMEVVRAGRGELAYSAYHWSGDPSYFTPVSCSRKTGGFLGARRMRQASRMRTCSGVRVWRMHKPCASSRFQGAMELAKRRSRHGGRRKF